MTQIKQTRISTAHFAAWTTVLLGFGLIQGAIYLKSYWSPFGIDPFQFSNASDLAVVGLTGIGVTVALVLLAALIGGYLAHVAVPLIESHKWIGWVTLVMLVAGIIALALFVDFGRHLVSGMLLTWLLLWLSHRSPDVPVMIKTSRVLPYLALAIAYVPMASHYYGQRNALNLIDEISVWQVDVVNSVGVKGMSASTRLAGRIGSEYVFYDPADKSVVIIPSSSVAKIALKKASRIGQT